VRAYIPEEWDGYLVESGPVSVETRAKGEGDARFVMFTALVDRAWIVVAEEDRVDDFRGINRF
jgi:hypothetical protein